MPAFRQAPLMTLLAAGLVCASGCGGGGGSAPPPPPPPPPPISVSVTPGSASVFLGATQQFTATVTNTSNTAVNWSVNGVPGGNSTLGTISAASLYTAPQVLPLNTTVTIQATSQADTTKSASATVTIQSDVAVSIAPSTPTVLLGGTQAFTANVTGSGNPNRGVTWSLSGTGCAGVMCGTIDASGLYTAPAILPSPATVTVTATSQADATKSSTTTVNLSSGNLTITVTGPASVDNGTPAQFTAVVTPEAGSNPSRSVTWSASCAGCSGFIGSIDGTGLYSAPPLAPSPNQVTLTATSLADPAKTGTKTIAVNAVILVTVSPTAAGVELESSQQFNATVAGTVDQRVIWDVNGITGGDPTVGTATNPASGPTSPTTYFAPVNIPASNPVTLRATSVASQSDPGGVKSAAASVTLFSNIAIALTPSSSTRAVGRRQTLQASVTNGAGGPANKNLTWSVNGIPGGDTSVGQICVSNFDPCQRLDAPTNAATVDYLAPNAVPPASPVLIAATSQADPSRSGSAQVAVIANLQVSISPANFTLPPNGTQSLSATVRGTADQRVTWTVNGILNGDLTVGRVCLPGTDCNPPAGPLADNVDYRAPATAPAAPLTIRAISAEDTNQSGSGTATIATGPLIRTLSPSSMTAASVDGVVLTAVGLNFKSSTPGPGSAIVFNDVPRTTSCSADTSCTTTLTSADVSAAGAKKVQIENPGGVRSNQASLLVVPPPGSDEVISLTPVNATATDKDVLVVESPPLPGVQPLNFEATGVFQSGSCIVAGRMITLTRPAAGDPPKEVSICVSGDAMTPQDTFTLSGPTPNDIELVVPPGQPPTSAFTELRLTLRSNTQPGLRSLFVENARKEKAAATGAIEVK